MGGAIAIQTQRSLGKSEGEWEDEEDEEEEQEDGETKRAPQEGTAVQLVKPAPWNGHADGRPGGAPGRQQASLPRSLSETTTVILPPR